MYWKQEIKKHLRVKNNSNEKLMTECEDKVSIKATENDEKHKKRKKQYSGKPYILLV